MPPVREGVGAMRIKTIGVLLVGAALTLSVSGCGLIAQQAFQKATGVSVNKNGNQLTVTGPNGKTATLQGDQNKLPDGLPGTVPTYPGATVKSATTITTDKGSNFTFAMETGDDVQTVAAWYKSQLKDKGWTVSSATSVPNATIFVAKMGASAIQVTVTKGDGGKTDVLTVANMVK